MFDNLKNYASYGFSKVMTNKADFFKDETAKSQLSIDNIIMLGIAVLVMSFLAPIALERLMNVNTSTWNSDVAAIWDILPIMVAVAFLIMIVYGYVSKKGGR